MNLVKDGVMQKEESKGTILIVDDAVINIEVLGSSLRNEGYEVLEAHDGEKALEVAFEHQPDLILLDVMMPGIDGYETCRELKLKSVLKNIPVIFLTVCSEERDILKGFEAGGVDYISKPFNTAELFARVNTHIELKRAREEISSLRGIIPICACCKKIRDDSGYWETVEEYVETHSDVQFSHGYCPDCEEKYYGDKDWWQKRKK